MQVDRLELSVEKQVDRLELSVEKLILLKMT